MIDKRQNLIFSFSLTNYSYPVFTEYKTPPRKPPISFFFHNKFIRNKIKGKWKKEIKWKIRLPSKCISFFAYFYTFWSYPSDTTTVVKWAHLCENLGGLRGSSHVSHVASRGFLQAFETGRKLAGSCQVIKIALYECHDLLTQNGNRKIVAGGEQIGIPWRTVGESFGAISHWTLSLSSSGLLSVWRHGFCDRVTWTSRSFFFYQATRRTKGHLWILPQLATVIENLAKLGIFTSPRLSSVKSDYEKRILFVSLGLLKRFWIRLLLSFSEI